ncbi:MAG: 2-amino-3,7-dideoxy-D-threo-hept-6-ulosonate synthase [Bacillota bacterium]|nr:2-amino-3,7-dideoxy-D-threo-hept-6-ulosonate synthase [Bacillota bacterium]
MEKMVLGKEKRLNRLFNNSGNIIIVPMDHGITLGPIKGIDCIQDTVSKLVKSNVDAILLHKGLINSCEKELINKNVATIMHLSASTSLNPSSGIKTVVGSVFEAVAFGCDAVSVHINIGNEYESEMFRDISKVSRDCYKYGMPLIAMMYARGKEITDENNVEVVKHAARVGAELGADIVKVNYTGSRETFKMVVDTCPVPVVISGGEKVDSNIEFLRYINDAIMAGARGVSIGRNIFQSEDMELLVKAIYKIVNLKEPIERVISELYV